MYVIASARQTVNLRHFGYESSADVASMRHQIAFPPARHHYGPFCYPYHTCQNVKQGNPLSSFLFALCMNDALININSDDHSFVCDGKRISYLAFADDLVLIANTSSKLQASIDSIITRTKQMGLENNASKCISLGIDFLDGKMTTSKTPFVNIEQQTIAIVYDADAVNYLGLRPLASLSACTITGKISTALTNLRQTCISPTQIIRLFNDYFLPTILYECTASQLSVTSLIGIDAYVRKNVKQILKIPLHVNAGFMHLLSSESGLGLRSVFYDVCSAMIGVYKHLTEYFSSFISPARNSDLMAAKTAINTTYDDKKSPRANNVLSLKLQLQKCPTQAL
ncbi:hypothetical protein GJ496_010537 [Pomphorhynchus laevis]|nr:hypothetical protein GJ496_010537 [Pomphorhynchus laevis]